MLAVILFCGTSVVLSSCGDDDDDNKGNVTTPNTYEVNISVVLPECAAEFFTLNVEYTDANGKTNTTTIKAGDQTETMSDELKTAYNNSKEWNVGMLNWDAQRAAIFDKVIVKNFKLSVPAGKSFSYCVTMKGRTEYTTPAGEVFDFIMPFVHKICKRISGTSADNSFVSGKLEVNAIGKVETAEIAEFIKTLDGTTVDKASITMQ